MQEGLRALTEQVKTNQGKYPGRGGGVGPPALKPGHMNLPFTSKYVPRDPITNPVIKSPAPSAKELESFKTQGDEYWPGRSEAQDDFFKTNRHIEVLEPSFDPRLQIRTQMRAMRTGITQGPEMIQTEPEALLYNMSRDNIFRDSLNIPGGAKTVDRTGVRGAPIFNKRIGAARRMLPKANKPGQLV